MKHFAIATALVFAAAVSASAYATTIVFTGNESDFPPTSLIEDDTVDTQLFDCGYGPVDAALDIGTVYCANDDDNLYLGFSYANFCFCDMQLGIAIETRPGGGTTDPFNRQIIWEASTGLPDFVIYNVIPVSCNNFNYEVIFEWDGAGWVNLGDGADAWGFVDPEGGNFKEFAIPLSLLGVLPGETICLEFWTTQDDFGSGLKPAFDMVVNDAAQKSTPGGTAFDVPDGEESRATEMFCKELETGPIPVEPTTWGAIKSTYR